MSLLSLFEEKPPFQRWLTILGCAIYVLSPIDFVPEAFLGPFGLADDAIAGLVLIRHVLFPGHHH
jgi:uncharacterized membrane protein YkvA (DUF1232 family)